MQIVCPHCLALNRVPDQRIGEAPNCGQCKSPLITGVPFALDESNFERFTARNELPVVIDFWATWCGPCKTMAPQFAAAARELAASALFAKLDTEAVPAIAARFKVRSIPTLLVLRNGVEIARETGARPASEIVRWVNQVIAAH